MWKLVRTELSYPKPWILILAGAFLAVALYSKCFLGHMKSIYFIGVWMVPYIIYACIGINLAIALLEVRESRVRQWVPLPVTIKQIALARPATTLLVVVLFFLIAVLDDPSILQDIPEPWIYPFGYAIRGEGYFSWLPTHYVSYSGHPFAISLMLFFSFAPRVMTGAPWRVVLSVAGLYLFVALIVRTAFSALYTRDLQSALYMEWPVRDATIVLTLSALVICFLIYFSFLKRRSYLG